jgi:hypothetical protein
VDFSPIRAWCCVNTCRFESPAGDLLHTLVAAQVNGTVLQLVLQHSLAFAENAVVTLPNRAWPASTHAVLCLLQVTCCFAQSVASTRWMIQDELGIQNTQCDNCIIGTSEQPCDGSSWQ